MRNGSVGTERCHMHVTDIATLPLAGLVLQILDELVLRLPLTPAMSGYKTVGQMLLRPRHIVIHLGLCGFLLQLLDLLRDVATSLGVKVDG